MSNMKDQSTEISRLLKLKNEKKDEEKDKNSKDDSPAREFLQKTQERKPLFGNEHHVPASKIGDTSSLFSRHRNLTEQDQKKSLFTQTSTTERLRDQKQNSSLASSTPSPLRTFSSKPVMPAPTNGISRSVVTEPGLSFKEKMEALQKKQAERLALNTPLNKADIGVKNILSTPTANIKSPFGSKVSGAVGGSTVGATATKPLFGSTTGATATRPSFGSTVSGAVGGSTAGATATRPSFGSVTSSIFTERKQTPSFMATRTQGDRSSIKDASPIVATQTKSDYKISSEEFTQLRDFLYEQSGIFIAENRKYLMENRLSSRLRELGLHNFNEYHNYLRFDNNRMTELNKLFENMTTNETSFFRNNPQLDIFKNKVLTRVINEQKEKGQKKIHIWSAGCSSGEEPYTIAMILHECLKGDIGNWNIKITANDLSLAMLETAKKGLYTEYALRTTPPEMISKYFTREGKNFKVLPSVQKLVNFGQINLANGSQLSKVERSHIVFCRNVIIYFDEEMKRHVINAFYDNLLPGGFLLIGHSESLHNLSRAFVPEHFTGAIVYGKKN